MDAKQFTDGVALRLRASRKEAGMEEYILPGAIGAGIGALTGEDRRAMLRNAILGALAGAGVKYGYKALNAQGAAGGASQSNNPVDYVLERTRIKERSLAEQQALEARKRQEIAESQSQVKYLNRRLSELVPGLSKNNPPVKAAEPPPAAAAARPAQTREQRAQAQPPLQVFEKRAPLYQTKQERINQLNKMQEGSQTAKALGELSAGATQGFIETGSSYLNTLANGIRHPFGRFGIPEPVKQSVRMVDEAGARAVRGNQPLTQENYETIDNSTANRAAAVRTGTR